MILKAIQIVVVFGVWYWFFISAPNPITLIFGCLFGLAVASMVTAAIYWTGEGIRELRRRVLARKPIKQSVEPRVAGYLVGEVHEPDRTSTRRR